MLSANLQLLPFVTDLVCSVYTVVCTVFFFSFSPKVIKFDFICIRKERKKPFFALSSNFSFFRIFENKIEQIKPTKKPKKDSRHKREKELHHYRLHNAILYQMQYSKHQFFSSPISFYFCISFILLLAQSLHFHSIICFIVALPSFKL